MELLLLLFVGKADLGRGGRGRLVATNDVAAGALTHAAADIAKMKTTAAFLAHILLTSNKSSLGVFVPERQ